MKRNQAAVVSTSPTHESGTRGRSDYALLGDVALQIVEESRGEIVVCDAELRVLAATVRAKLIVGARETEMLPAAILEAVRGSCETTVDATVRVVVRLSGAASVTVRIQRLRDLGPATLALVLEEVSPQGVGDILSLTSALGLSVRQRQLVHLLRRGLSNRDIAMSLRLTEGTVKIYLHELFSKLEVDSRMQLVAKIGELLSRRKGA
jgi:DNA-binding NarL/FixJ family response regulator